MTLFESWLMGIIAEGNRNMEFQVLPFQGQERRHYLHERRQRLGDPQGSKEQGSGVGVHLMSDADIWRKAGEAQKKEVERKKGVYIPSLLPTKSQTRCSAKRCTPDAAGDR